jgi:hypothetical protein
MECANLLLRIQHAIQVAVIALALLVLPEMFRKSHLAI